jgi:hypothetical protein
MTPGEPPKHRPPPGLVTLSIRVGRSSGPHSAAQTRLHPGLVHLPPARAEPVDQVSDLHLLPRSRLS